MYSTVRLSCLVNIKGLVACRCIVLVVVVGYRYVIVVVVVDPHPRCCGVPLVCALPPNQDGVVSVLLVITHVLCQMVDEILQVQAYEMASYYPCY